MNHRYEERSFERGERDRNRDQPYSREWRTGEGRREYQSRDYDPDRYWSNERSGREPWRSEGQGGRDDYGYRDRSGEDYYGAGSRKSWGDWEPQRERGSSEFGRYSSQSRYGESHQGSQRDYGGEEFGRRDFRPEESPPYYGTGSYSSGGSGLGGGYRGLQGMGAYGPSGASYGSQYGVVVEGRNDWSRDERRRDEGGRRGGFLGRFFGRGPKGYKRSDERLREDISERLMHSGTVDSSDVTVEVADGIVTLTGTVPDRYMKYAIEDVADTCAGIKDVDNRVRVQRSDYGSSEGVAGSAFQSGSSTGTSTNTTAGTSTGSTSTSATTGSSRSRNN